MFDLETTWLFREHSHKDGWQRGKSCVDKVFRLRPNPPQLGFCLGEKANLNPTLRLYIIAYLLNSSFY